MYYNYCLAFTTRHTKGHTSTIRIKLTGDGTRIARGFSIVNFAFTILEEGRVQSVFGNHLIAILKIAKSYEELLADVQDICEEAKDLEVISIKEKVYKIIWFLGGVLKFLATVCGLDSVNAVFGTSVQKFNDLT